MFIPTWLIPNPFSEPKFGLTFGATFVLRKPPKTRSSVKAQNWPEGNSPFGGKHFRNSFFKRNPFWGILPGLFIPGNSFFWRHHFFPFVLPEFPSVGPQRVYVIREGVYRVWSRGEHTGGVIPPRFALAAHLWGANFSVG